MLQREQLGSLDKSASLGARVALQHSRGWQTHCQRHRCTTMLLFASNRPLYFLVVIGVTAAAAAGRVTLLTVCS